MFDRKIYCGKLSFQFQFCTFILILYLKLNHLNASPLIDPNKDGVEFVLKSPYVMAMTDDSLEVLNGDKENPIENDKVASSTTVESEILKNSDEEKNHTKGEHGGKGDKGDKGENGEKDESDEKDKKVTRKPMPLPPDNSTAEEGDNGDLVNDYIVQFSANGANSCMLDGLKEHMMSWAYPNGSLILPNTSRSGIESPEFFVDKSHRKDATDESLAAELSSPRRRARVIIAFSAAFNGFTYAPYKTLYNMRSTLQFLMLKGNNFSSYRAEADSIRNVLLREIKKKPWLFNGTVDTSEEGVKKEQNIAWATFPELPALSELDISSCMITHITPYAFKNLTKLRTLYLSHNKLLRIPSMAFETVPNLRYLDLSHINAVDLEFTIPLPTWEQLVNVLVGVKIDQHTFRHLSKLEYLDLSYTKITRNSAVAFANVGPRLKYVSLCFTAFPVLGSSMFKNGAIRGLDLSGNSYAAYSLTEDSFASVAHSLQFLFFEQSNLKELDWLRKLRGLLVLNLNSNNINTLSLETFPTLRHLQVLDLSSNHIGNWYNRVFTNNTNLRILNLRDNNINILTSEMLIDFQELDYLGIGDNNFVCDCVLRDFVDIATANNKKADCVNNVFTNTQSLVQENLEAMKYSSNIRDYEIPIEYSGYMAVVKKYLPMLSKSYHNIRKEMDRLKMFNVRIVTNYYKVLSSNSCPDPDQIIIYDKINGSTLKFQLLDYEDEHYWCFNETEKLNFFELNCESRYYTDLITSEIRHITKYVLIAAGIIIFLSLVVFVVYLKRWHIHYYYSSLKSAALLSVAAQENCEKFKELSESDSNLVYDLFISYCQSDREWVLEELMPNIEIADDMSICMHERDFQVGLTILDNIISCMDRSRCLMLVISSNFLLSHWCQFEMRLAQHRMFEASKEHLILVFLEDIPKRKRPKTLQYLMDVKTYIKWPTGASANAKWDEKKVFWKRLRKSIKNICWDGPPRL